MPDSRDTEPLQPSWPADDPRWRMVQEGTEGITVNGRPLPPFDPDDWPHEGEDGYPDRL